MTDILLARLPEFTDTRSPFSKGEKRHRAVLLHFMGSHLYVPNQNPTVLTTVLNIFLLYVL